MARTPKRDGHHIAGGRTETRISPWPKSKEAMMKTPFDIQKAPWTAIWETTQACDIACLDYGDCIQPDPDPLELTTQEAEQLVREVAGLQPRIFLMTGADPLKRADLEHLVRYAVTRGVRP